MRRLLRTIDRALAAVVSVIVVLLLLVMVALSFAQVVLRNALALGIPWAELVLQHAVLAVGLFGAVLAARQGRQIAIDVFSRVAGSRVKTALSWAGGLFTIVISLVLSRAAWVFVASEKEFGTELTAGLPAWPFQLAIPAGFALIALQMALNLALGRTITPEHPESAAAKAKRFEPAAPPDTSDETAGPATPEDSADDHGGGGAAR